MPQRPSRRDRRSSHPLSLPGISGRGVASGRAASAHHVPPGSPSGINGHDLALGSGSIDGIVGGAVFASWKRAFTTMSVQHAIETEGDYRYQYRDETNWFVSLGGYPLLDDRYTLALQFVTSGTLSQLEDS